MRPCGYCKSNESMHSEENACLLWLVTIGELHVEALSPENRVLNYKIDLLAPFPKRESRWVKETGGWIHEEKNKGEF